MIEQLMIFALGFLCSGLLALLFLPAFWRRALRLSRRRLEMQMPLSMDEIVAERDQLRAEFAAERRRLEQAQESLQTARANDMGELGRRAASLVALEADVTQLRAAGAALERDLAEATRSRHDAEGAFAAMQKEIYDAVGLADRRAAALGALRGEHTDLTERYDSARMEIAGLEAQVEGLRVTLEDAEADLAQTRLQLAEKRSAADLFAQERDYALADIAHLNARRDALQQTLDEAHRRIEEMQAAARESQRVRARMAQDLESAAKELESAVQSGAELRATLERQAAAARDKARKQAERLQAMRSERDSLQGALEAVRREAETLRHERAVRRDAAANAPDQDDSDVLRRAIADLGGDVARLAQALERESAVRDDAATPAERMRELQDRAGAASRTTEAASRTTEAASRTTEAAT